METGKPHAFDRPGQGRTPPGNAGGSPPTFLATSLRDISARNDRRLWLQSCFRSRACPGSKTELHGHDSVCVLIGTQSQGGSAIAFTFPRVPSNHVKLQPIGRLDDWWSWFYSICYLYYGDLPWYPLNSGKKRPVLTALSRLICATPIPCCLS